jgi:hypothetical protein
VITNDVTDSYQQVYIIAHIICNHSIFKVMKFFGVLYTGASDAGCIESLCVMLGQLTSTSMLYAEETS